MKYAVIAGAALCLGVATAAYAATPKIEAAIKTIKATGGDPAKVKAFCEMSKLMETTGEKENPAAEAKIDGYMKQLGPDFETAWNAGDGLDENSADGKVLFAAMDELQGKCP